jgi:plastocyanin
VNTSAPSAAYGPRRVAKAAEPTGSELPNVVVFIQDAPKSATVPPGRARILQQNEAFVPRVVAITRGSTVDFPNGDPFFHDVFSLSRSGTFDLGSYPKGQTRSHQFRQAGLVKVYCHIHSHMSASIMVFDHTFFTIPREDGSFTIDDVPAGNYKVSAWHERIGENSQPVKIEPGRASDIQFALPIGAK